MALNKHHQLYQLAEVVDWIYLEERINQAIDIGSTEKFRLITGLLYVKSMLDFSHEEVLERWLTCPYLRHFCGVDYQETPEAAPLSAELLKMWDRLYGGKPYDAMTYALFRANVFDKVAA